LEEPAVSIFRVGDISILKLEAVGSSRMLPIYQITLSGECNFHTHSCEDHRSLVSWKSWKIHFRLWN